MSALSCEAARRLVSPYLDGELVGENRAAFTAHVEHCGSCRRVLADEEAVIDAVRRTIERPQAFEALRARIEAGFDGERSRRLRRDWIAAAVAALLLVGMGIAGAWRVKAVDGPVPVPRPDASDDLTALTADTHLRYTRGQLPLEVDSSRPDVVSGFFSGRVPFHLALPDYPVRPGESKPYRLLGAPPRLVPQRLRRLRRVSPGRPADLAAGHFGGPRTAARGRHRRLRPARLPPEGGPGPEGHHLGGQGPHLLARLRSVGERSAILRRLSRLARGATPARRLPAAHLIGDPS